MDLFCYLKFAIRKNHGRSTQLLKFPALSPHKKKGHTDLGQNVGKCMMKEYSLGG